jgi:hypothetical protein
VGYSTYRTRTIDPTIDHKVRAAVLGRDDEQQIAEIRTLLDPQEAEQ